MRARVAIFGLHNDRRIASTRVRRIALETLRALRLQGDFEIVFAGPKLMQRLNRVYRGKNRATEVLAFSYSIGRRGTKPRTEDLVRGQIFVGVGRATSENPDKLTRLLVHAIVHMKGYDHATRNSARRMERIEKKILAQISIF